VAYEGVLVDASLAVAANGEIEMIDDNPAVDLAAFEVPAPSFLDLRGHITPPKPEEPREISPAPPTLLADFGESARQEAGSRLSAGWKNRKTSAMRWIVPEARPVIRMRGTWSWSTA
jgi:hypothetical protein